MRHAETPAKPAAPKSGSRHETLALDTPAGSSAPLYYNPNDAWGGGVSDGAGQYKIVGLTAGSEIELGRGLRVRPAAAGELTASWPEAGRLLPTDFGREVDRMLVLELERDIDGTACEVPDAPAEIQQKMLNPLKASKKSSKK